MRPSLTWILLSCRFQVRKLSVKRIVNPEIFDNLKNPRPDGLYDAALGPTDLNGRCATCGLNGTQCPGHFGHIELPVPVYNPLIFGTLYKLLRQTCLHCFHFKMAINDVCAPTLTSYALLDCSPARLLLLLPRLVRLGLLLDSWPHNVAPALALGSCAMPALPAAPQFQQARPPALPASRRLYMAATATGRLLQFRVKHGRKGTPSRR